MTFGGDYGLAAYHGPMSPFISGRNRYGLDDSQRKVGTELLMSTTNNGLPDVICGAPGFSLKARIFKANSDKSRACPYGDGNIAPGTIAINVCLKPLSLHSNAQDNHLSLSKLHPENQESALTRP
eukprot:1240248-Amphidinium_carterae.1